MERGGLENAILIKRSPNRSLHGRACARVLPTFLVGAAEAGCDIISFPSTTECLRVKLITTSCSSPLIGRSRIPSRPRGQQIRSAAAIYWTAEAQRGSNTGSLLLSQRLSKLEPSPASSVSAETRKQRKKEKKPRKKRPDRNGNASVLAPAVPALAARCPHSDRDAAPVLRRPPRAFCPPDRRICPRNSHFFYFACLKLSYRKIKLYKSGKF